ncbi:uncharacterized protein RAG0_11614 [Rhynchosporium agropyri]|uniref:Uncharacterized protein n=1 Tax=Rhynchosporium agropyri TaxID=914238 RepID=A0A1E1L546_9HELO|nr:uncharacterized protein RAG0_11614 [Rhynchosporium agropyri]
MPLDATLPSEASSPGFETTSLQTLPPELRQQIYNEIFKIYHCDYTYPFPYRIYTDTAHRYCRCGQGLSLTSHFFYKETRHLYYKHATFVFEAPLSCVRFFNGIGSQSENVGALSISFSYREIYLLRTLFNRPSLKSLISKPHVEAEQPRGNIWILRLAVISDSHFQVSTSQSRHAESGIDGSEPFNLSLLPGAESPPLEELIFMSPENNKYGIAITYAISTKVIVKPEPCFGSSANTIEGFLKQFFRDFFVKAIWGARWKRWSVMRGGFMIEVFRGSVWRW